MIIPFSMCVLVTAVKYKVTLMTVGRELLEQMSVRLWWKFPNLLESVDVKKSKP
jgi:hypothetical protein